MAGTHQSQHRRTRDTENLEHSTSEILQHAYQEFKERGDDVKTLVKEYVNEKPIRALSIALFTGMALALFLKR